MPQLGRLALSPSEAEENHWIADAIRKQACGDSVIRILEAGCGQRWLVKLDGVKYHLTGVDLDQHALALRQQIQKDLHETIVGDLRTVDLGSGRFDVVFSSFVLEHIPGAEKVLGSFVRWLRPEGS
jgi:2-polyprenyl-3-methyl-5-hydroxy-6-metoxy-1,4-benzoquinol methylase